MKKRATYAIVIITAVIIILLIGSLPLTYMCIKEDQAFAPCLPMKGFGCSLQNFNNVTGNITVDVWDNTNYNFSFSNSSIVFVPITYVGAGVNVGPQPSNAFFDSSEAAHIPVIVPSDADANGRMYLINITAAPPNSSCYSIDGSIWIRYYKNGQFQYQVLASLIYSSTVIRSYFGILAQSLRPEIA
jgi:hypothetical protein